MSKRSSNLGLRYNRFKAGFYRKLDVDKDTKTLIKFINRMQEQC